MRRVGGGDPSAEATAGAEAPSEPKISAEQELLNDFDDSDEDEEQDGGKQEGSRQDAWVSSDSIDFSQH